MKPKIIIPIVVVILALSAFFVFKNAFSKSNTNSNASNSQAAAPTFKENSSDCAVTLKTAYQSLTAMNGAPTEGQDVRSNYWHITFNDKTVVWQQADRLVAGTYTCHGTQIEAKINSETKVGSYNSDTKTLVFDGQEYKIAGQ